MPPKQMQDIMQTHDIVSQLIDAHERNGLEYDDFMDCCNGNIQFLAFMVNKLPSASRIKKEITRTLFAYYAIANRPQLQAQMWS